MTAKDQGIRTSGIWTQIRHGLGNWFPGHAQYLFSVFLLLFDGLFDNVSVLWGLISLRVSLRCKMWPIESHSKQIETSAIMLSSGIFARVAFYPSLLWGIVTESSTKRWYDRVDTNIILGALPFKSQTKEVSAPFEDFPQAIRWQFSYM